MRLDSCKYICSAISFKSRFYTLYHIGKIVKNKLDFAQSAENKSNYSLFLNEPTYAV